MELTHTEIMDIIEKKIKLTAAKQKDDAALSGYHHDGGSSDLLKELRFFAKGVEFAANPVDVRNLPVRYHHIINEHLRETDPEFQRLKELAEKYSMELHPK